MILGLPAHSFRLDTPDQVSAGTGHGIGEWQVDADEAAAIAAVQKRCHNPSLSVSIPIEREMFIGPWVMVDSYTICDPYLFTLAQWIETDGVAPTRFPKIHSQRQDMSEPPQ